MSGRRAIVGLCALCALLVSAFAAQGASAAGTTAYTCANTGTQVGAVQFSDSHCKTANGSTGPWRHVAFAGETVGTASGETTKLKATIGGTAVTLTATSVNSENGTLINKEEGGEMFVYLTGRLHYTNVTANKTGCVVREDTEAGGKGTVGTIKTAPLIATTKGQGDAGLVEPVAPSNIFATFWIEGCENAAINGTHTVLGKVKTTSIEGATANFTHANTTAQETLGLDSLFNPAGIEGSLTIKGPNGNAISVTT